MSDPVSVIFSAQIGDLISGVEEVKRAILSVKDSTDQISGAFRSMAEVIGISLGVDGIKNFVESMASLGLQTERSMATLGLSAQQVGILSGVAKLTGTSVEGLEKSIERLSLNVQKSTKDAFNPAAESLKVLGLSAKDLIGLPTDQYFAKLTEAISKFNPSLNLTNAVMAVGGRGVAQLLPLLMQGKEHFDEMEAAIRATGATLDDVQAKAFAQTHEKLTLLGMSVQGLGIKIFNVLNPAIESVVDSMSKWTQSITSDQIRNVLNTIGDTTISIAQTLAIFFIDARESWEKFVSSINSHMSVVHTAAAAVLMMAGQTYAAAKQLRAAAEDSELGEGYEAIAARANSARDAINHMAEDARKSLNANVPKSGTWDAISADLTNINREVVLAADGFLKLNAAAINTGGKNSSDAALAAAQEQIKLADMVYSQQVEKINSELKLHLITESEKVRETIAALEQRHAAELAALDREAAIGGLSKAQYQKIQNEKLTVDQKYAQDRQKIMDQAAQADWQTWKTAADQIAGAWNSQMRPLLSGQETLGQALKKISGDVALKYIGDLNKWVIEWGAAQLRALFASNAAKTADVATTVSAEAAKTAAATTGAGARAAAETAGASTGILAQIGNAFAVITADAAKTFAGVFAFLAPEMGPAAAGPATAAGAAVQAAAAAVAVPGLAVGTDYVLSPGLAFLHTGEKVLPAQTSGPYSGAGGAPMIFAPNLSAFNPSGLQQVVMQMMPQFARALAAYQRVTPSLNAG